MTNYEMELTVKNNYLRQVVGSIHNETNQSPPHSNFPYRGSMTVGI